MAPGEERAPETKVNLIDWPKQSLVMTPIENLLEGWTGDQGPGQKSIKCGRA